MQMSDFKITPEIALSAHQMMERYQLNDYYTLLAWAEIHSIDTNRGFYKPEEIDLIDHVHHHIQNLGMTMGEYQEMLKRSRYGTNSVSSSRREEERSINQPANSYSELNNELNREGDRPLNTTISNEAYQAIEMLTNQYSEAVEIMAEKMAERFIEDLDASVMRHLLKKVQERQNPMNKRPNLLVRTINAIFGGSPEKTTLQGMEKKTNDWDMEQHHRLG
jgi:hypothetical protein